MNKPRKYNGVYKLPIKKHTKVRRPMSRWKITLRENDEIGIVLRGAYTPLVKDITQNLVKYPLDTTYTITFPKALNDIKWQDPKPSLLTRVIERFKR